MTLIYRLRDGPNKLRGRNVAAAHPDRSSGVFQEDVETRQIAPTIPARAGIDIDELKERARRTYPALARLRRLNPLGTATTRIGAARNNNTCDLFQRCSDFFFLHSRASLWLVSAPNRAQPTAIVGNHGASTRRHNPFIAL